MSSNHVEDFLTEYIDGNLTGATYDRVKSHLVFCTNCRQLHHDILANISKLKSVPKIEPSKDLEKRILNALSEKNAVAGADPDPARPSWSQWFLSFRGMSLAGAAVLLIFIVQNVPKMISENPPTKSLQAGKGKTKTIDAARLKPEAKENRMGAEAGDASISKVVQTPADKSRSDATFDSAKLPAAPTVSGLAAQASPSTSEKASFKMLKTDDSQIISGVSSGISQPLEKVISDQKTWEDYWARHQKGAIEKGPAPWVDFEKNEIIAVFVGNQPSAGFQVEITRVLLTQWENAPARVVRYRVSGPPEGAMVAMVVTQPFCIKIVPKMTGPTFFKRIR